MGKVKYFGVKLGKGYGKHAEQPHPNSQKAPFNLSRSHSLHRAQPFFSSLFSLTTFLLIIIALFFKSYSQGNTLRIGDLDIFSFGVMVLSLGTRRFPSQEKLNL